MIRGMLWDTLYGLEPPVSSGMEGLQWRRPKKLHLLLASLFDFVSNFKYHRKVWYPTACVPSVCTTIEEVYVTARILANECRLKFITCLQHLSCVFGMIIIDLSISCLCESREKYKNIGRAVYLSITISDRQPDGIMDSVKERLEFQFNIWRKNHDFFGSKIRILIFFFWNSASSGPSTGNHSYKWVACQCVGCVRLQCFCNTEVQWFLNLLRVHESWSEIEKPLPKMEHVIDLLLWARYGTCTLCVSNGYLKTQVPCIHKPNKIEPKC